MPNYSIAVFLLNPETVRGMIGVYEPDGPAGTKQPKREFFKTFDKSLKKDDLVIVPTGTRWGMTVFKILEVDVEPDLDTQEKIEWIIGKVDDTAYKQILAQEDVAIKAMQSAERNKRRRDLAAAMMANTPELKNLTIGTASPPAQPEHDPQF